MRRHGGARSIISGRPLNSCLLQLPPTIHRVAFPFLVVLIITAATIPMVDSTSVLDSGLDDDFAAVEIKTFASADGPKGVFSSPNFPNAYPKNAQTRFQFRAAPDEVVWITWGTFVLEEPFSANGLCMRDYVEVIVIDYHNVQHVSGRYCGTNKPPNFRTMQQSVDIIFQSSYTKHYQGFNGTYNFYHEKDLPAPDSRYAGKVNAEAHGCGGIRGGEGTFGGTIQSPGYPERYPENIECSWVIRVQPGKKVYVRILELQLTTSKTDCAEAQLSVMDGYAHYIYENSSSSTPHEKHMVRFCGEDKYYKEEGARSYMSTRNRMVVRFNTTKPPPKQMFARREEYGSPIGFYLVWTEVLPVDEKDDKNSQCDKFLCRGGDYCLDETQTVCAERRRYCIDKSLLCDGIPNCAELDESDEENCYSKEIVAAGASLFLLLVLIIVAVICCQRRRGRIQLHHIRRAASQTPRQVNNTGPMNATNSLHGLSSEDTQLLKASTINKFDSNSTTIGPRGDITAFPQNYHPARSGGGGGGPSMLVDDIVSPKDVVFSVPTNHVSTYAAPLVSKIGADQMGRRGGGERIVATSPEDSSAERSLSTSAEGGSILRRRQGGGVSSVSSGSSRVPLIKVMSAPEGGEPGSGGEVWEEQAEQPIHCDRHQPQQHRPMQKRGNVDTSTVTWSYESSKPIAYSPTPAHMRQYDSDGGGGAGGSTTSGAIEMVTFNAAGSKPMVPPSTAIPTASGHRASAIKPQGILKSTSSLPGAGDQREPRPSDSSIGAAHPIGKRISIPAPPPQIPPHLHHHLHQQQQMGPSSSSNASKPPPPSYSQALARLGRQKAVEFVDELPRRHDSNEPPPPPPPPPPQVSSSLAPLMLSPPSGGGAVGDDSEGGDGRSPSPWHRLKPSVV